jgi:hypothetical protein
VLPRLFRALLHVEAAVKDRPDEQALAADVDLDAIRGMVVAALPAPAGS